MAIIISEAGDGDGGFVERVFEGSEDSGFWKLEANEIAGDLNIEFLSSGCENAGHDEDALSVCCLGCALSVCVSLESPLPDAALVTLDAAFALLGAPLSSRWDDANVVDKELNAKKGGRNDPGRDA